MEVPWIQNYLLRSSLKRDAHDLCHAHSFISAHLSFPVISSGYFVAGIGISSTTVHNSGGVFYPGKRQLYRYLHNATNQYFLLFYEGLETVDVIYQSYKNVSGDYAKLKFNRRLFMHTFDESLKSGKIDVSQINASLLQSISSTLNGPRIAEVLGNNTIHENLPLIKRVVCSYANSSPMMAFHSYTRASASPLNEENTLRGMRDFGITDRLQKLQIDRVSEMSHHNWMNEISLLAMIRNALFRLKI